LNLTRRGFLQLFGLAAPVAAVAPTYFFAPVGGWHSDTIVNPNEAILSPRVGVPLPNPGQFIVAVWTNRGNGWEYNYENVDAAEIERVKISDTRPKVFWDPPNDRIYVNHPGDGVIRKVVGLRV
jgi:hypothetical protein